MSSLNLHVVDLLTRLLFDIISLYKALTFVGDQIQLDISGDLNYEFEIHVNQGLTPDGVTINESVCVLTNSFDSVIFIRSPIDFSTKDWTPVDDLHLQLVVSNIVN